METEKFRNAENVYKDDLSKNADPFAHMLSMQKMLQEELFVKNPKIQNINDLETLGKKAEWLRDNKIAFDDEFRETLDALAGIDKCEKDRSALWKKWKSDYNKIRSQKFSDLTEREKIELKFEVCDMFHFFMNMMLGLDMSSEEMFIYYYYKNAENLDRIKRNY